MNESQPLQGRCILVTRPRERAESLRSALAALGADVVVTPAIRIEPPADPAPLHDAAARADEFDWIVFTSVNGVDAFFGATSTLPHCEIAAIGPATAGALTERGVRVTLVPERHVAEEVFDALARHTSLAGKRFLLPIADIARDVLPKLLRSGGANVEVVPAYSNVAATKDIARAVELVRRGTVDAVTFTSSSTVRSFVSAMDDTVRAKLVPASIGPITSATLREENIEPVIEAERHTSEGLVDAIRRHFAHQKSPRMTR